MKYDQHGVIVREKDGGPGDLGDSCADTARIAALDWNQSPRLEAFITDIGYVRHPDAPWREDDFSGDQATPLMIAFDMRSSKLATQMRSRLYNWVLPNKTILPPNLWAIIQCHFNFLGVLCVLQALLFLIPIRWSDSKKFFEFGGDETDYLNWIVTLHYLKYFRNITWPHTVCYLIRSPKRALNKVERYYANQPRSDWIVSVYAKVLSLGQ